ncbi:MAG TPA: diguanylate cyclase [Casimicrobiaceae bacterium]|jgi:PleD family two-component response regulator|nr:diguanylate cyclase [Casimicrobiaceae bacterium]
MACRFGGEEFAVVMAAVSSAQASAVVEGLFVDFARTEVLAGGRPLSGRAYSAGLAEFPTEGPSLQPVPRVADAHLFRAKMSVSPTEPGSRPLCVFGPARVTSVQALRAT